MGKVRLPDFNAELCLDRENSNYFLQQSPVDAINLVIPSQVSETEWHMIEGGTTTFGEQTAQYYGFDTSLGEGAYCADIYDAMLAADSEGNKMLSLYFQGLAYRDCRFGTSYPH